MLWLDTGDVYIGMTTNPVRRLMDHKKGVGSIHTKDVGITSMRILWNGAVKNKYQALLIENGHARRWKQKLPNNNVHGGELSKRYKKICIKKAFSNRS